jgi:hypothetical protein
MSDSDEKQLTRGKKAEVSFLRSVAGYRTANHKGNINVRKKLGVRDINKVR